MGNLPELSATNIAKKLKQVQSERLKRKIHQTSYTFTCSWKFEGATDSTPKVYNNYLGHLLADLLQNSPTTDMSIYTITVRNPKGQECRVSYKEFITNCWTGKYGNVKPIATKYHPTIWKELGKEISRLGLNKQTPK